MLGSNVSTVGGLHKAFVQALEWKCDAIQIYTTPSRRWEVPELSYDQRCAFEQAREGSGVKAIIAHVPFLVNICAPAQAALERSRRRLVEEVKRAALLSVGCVVLHPGATGGEPRKVALRKAAATIREAVDLTSDLDVRILIENMAGQGTTLCARFEEIADLLGAIGMPARVGVCFDTAHAFMAGYPLSGYRGYEEVLGQFDQLVGCSAIFALHINDSKTGKGSRHDRHAPVGEGQMGLQVFHALVRDSRFASLPRVLEVPDRDAKSFSVLKLLRQLSFREVKLPEESAGPGATQLNLLPEQ